MSLPRSLLTVTVALSALLLAPALARADAGAAIVRQCLNQGTVSGHYSQQAYSQALAELPADVTEYSDCPNLIRQAMLAAAARSGAATGGSNVTPATASAAAPLNAGEKAALSSATHPRGSPRGVQIGPQLIRPGVVHANLAAAISKLPTPLLALLAVIASGALFAGGRVAYQRVGPRRGH
jgi:hypothetical protein